MRTPQRVGRSRQVGSGRRYRVEPYAASVAGGREYNQDNVRALSFNPRQNLWRLSALLVVADGMGGHEDGVVASEVAVDTIVEVLGASRKDKGQFAASWFQLRFEEVVRRAIKLANKRIYARGVDTSPGRRMGTTLILVAIGRHGAVIGHVGDSRAYQLTTKGFHQLTQDHSFVAEARRSGTMTEEEAARSPYRSHITRTVGTKEDVEPDVIKVSLSRPLAFLLCSDGLTTVCTDAEIEATIREYTSATEATRALVELAERNHTEDNVSVGVVDIGGVLEAERVRIIEPRFLVWAAVLVAAFAVGAVARLVVHQRTAPLPEERVVAVTQQQRTKAAAPTEEAAAMKGRIAPQGDSAQPPAHDPFLELQIRVNDGNLEAYCNHDVTLVAYEYAHRNPVEVNVSARTWQHVGILSGKLATRWAERRISVTISRKGERLEFVNREPEDLTIYVNGYICREDTRNLQEPIERIGLDFPARNEREKYGIRITDFDWDALGSGGSDHTTNLSGKEPPNPYPRTNE